MIRRASILGLVLIAGSGWAQTICIDPGHPSEIGIGTKGKRLREVQVAWEVAVLLKARLAKLGYRVVLTKQSAGEYVANKDRAAIANRAKADLMIRLHCDHAVGSRGLGTFFADRQGRHEGKLGPDRATLSAVAKMAPAFHGAAIRALKGMLPDRGVRTDRQTSVGAKYGALIGSIHCHAPSILVEMAVLSSPADEAFLAKTEGKQAMANALAKGVQAALKAKPKASAAGSPTQGLPTAR